MEDRIKTAADNMLTKGSITDVEHGELCKVALKFKDITKGLETLGGKRQKIINLLGGLALLGGGVYAGKEAVIDPLVQAVKINKSFKAMAQKVPQLADQDQKQMKDYFNVIKTFSPKAASNPLVAGALVNKMMQFGGVDHKLVQDISAIQAGLPQPRVAPTVVESVAKAVGSAAIPTEKTISEFNEYGNLQPMSVTTQTGK